MANNEFIQRYADEFVEKVFYFCLKKCGSPAQAEDLASEINCNVLNALNRDSSTQNFPAWVWAIARNQYSKWAIRKRKARENLLPDDVGEYEAVSENSFEDKIVQSEQLKILRRELAFVTKEYREILIAYYIDGRKTEEIATSIHLPKGTVLSKLHRIRNKLKEGFDMSRVFGVLSYKPENVGFVMNGESGRDGAPWCFLSRLIAKNIMLACYRNPQTAEELAIEMGIALPYMENELIQLVHSTLMKQSGDKYETAIFIVSAKAQERCYSHIASIASELTALLTKAVEYGVKRDEQNGSRWHEGYQAYEDMKWALLMQKVDELYSWNERKHIGQRKGENIGRNGHTIRPYNGQWDLLGLEDCATARPPFVGLHGCGETPEYSGDGYNYQFGQYKFNYERINEQTTDFLSLEQLHALVAISCKTPEKAPAVLVEDLIRFGYVKKEGAELLPTIKVTFADKIKPPTAEQQAEYQQLIAPAEQLLESQYQVCREAVLAEVPFFLRDNEFPIKHAVGNLMFPRESIFKQALDTGWLKYDKADPESAKRRMLGAYLVIGLKY